MDLGQLFMGLGLAAWGAGVYALIYFMVRDEERARALVEARWSIDRLMHRSLRTGRVSQDQWVASQVRFGRRFEKWVARPFMVLWFTLCGLTIMKGIFP